MFELPLVQASSMYEPEWHSGWLRGWLPPGWCWSSFTSPSVRESAWRVAAWISAAYWFTASTSFANPAITIARSLSDTFAGIRPVDVTAFIGAQLIGGLLGLILARYFLPGRNDEEARSVAVRSGNE